MAKKKVKKKTKKQKSNKNKAAWAAKRKADAAARAAARAEAKLKKKAIEKPAADKPLFGSQLFGGQQPATEKPLVEYSPVEPKPWPRAGDNKEFQAILDEAVPPIEPKLDESKEPDERRLEIEDVAEWVTWPFSLWSQSQKLQPIIQSDEALEIAKPLTRILNRHGVSDRIPPDLLDGMQVIGRTIPVVKRGNVMIELERQRRAKAGPGTEAVKGNRSPQGAPPTEPKEV